MTIDPFLSNAIGGIKLMVAEAQIERAKEILKNYDLPDWVDYEDVMKTTILVLKIHSMVVLYFS